MLFQLGDEARDDGRRQVQRPCGGSKAALVDDADENLDRALLIPQGWAAITCATAAVSRLP